MVFMVLVSFALGHKLELVLALADEVDPSPLVAAGYGSEVDRARAVLERFRVLAGDSELTPQQARSIEWMRSLDPRRPDPKKAAPWGFRSEPLGHRPCDGLNQFLQRPLDRWHRMARAASTDSQLNELLDDWLRAIDQNYATLVAQADTAHGELSVDAEALDGQGWDGLHSPARFIADGEEIMVATDTVPAGEGLISPQPEGIHAVPGERWHIQGHVLDDGTLLPCWGTYRISRAV